MDKSIRLTIAAIVLMLSATSANAGIIGIDNIHGFGGDAILGSGSDFVQFRTAIQNQGHTIQLLSSFDAADLIGLDAVILNTPYSQNSANYTGGEIAAVNSFASDRAAFVGDSSLWQDVGAGSDRDISFGDNQLLLENIVNWIVQDRGALFLGEDGTGFDVTNMNLMTANYGVSFSNTPVDGDGRTVTGFVAHPVTAGVSTIGVDFHLPMTIGGGATDLTIGSDNDNVLAVYEVASVPEPGMLALLAVGLAGIGLSRRKQAS